MQDSQLVESARIPRQFAILQAGVAAVEVEVEVVEVWVLAALVVSLPGVVVEVAVVGVESIPTEFVIVTLEAVGVTLIAAVEAAVATLEFVEVEETLWVKLHLTVALGTEDMLSQALWSSHLEVNEAEMTCCTVTEVWCLKTRKELMEACLQVTQCPCECFYYQWEVWHRILVDSEAGLVAQASGG